MKLRLGMLLFIIGFSGWSHQVYNGQQQLSWRAHNGNAVAQYRLGQEYWENQSRTGAHYWWQRAAQQQFYPAIENLIQQFPASHDDWLRLAAEAGDLSAQREVATAELADENISLTQWQRRWADSNEPWLIRQQALLSRYQRTKQCGMTIKVIAAGLGDKERYLNFLDAVESSPFDSGNWCISWVQDSSLSCISRSERNRASCESEKTFNKQVILADKGIASATNGTLTLTSDSSKKVIQHELGHWMGLADEYEMSEPLAREFCYGNYDHKSFNIVVTDTGRSYSAAQVEEIYKGLPGPWRKEIGSWQRIATQKGQQWLLGSSGGAKVGLYKADTCNSISERQAWRPVRTQTAMEAHSTGLWPELYLKLITNQ